MSFSKNISYNPSIFTSGKQEVHRHHLNIATINLDDINLRFGTNVKLIYNDKKYQFDIPNYSPFDSTIQNEINRLCIWALQDNKNSLHWVKPYIMSVESDRDEALMYANNPYFHDKKHFIFLKDKFINTYKDYYPKGFLDEEVETLIKEKLNFYCNELSEVLDK